MTCKDVMKTDVHCVTPKDTVQTAARLMRDHHVGFLPVCDDSHRVLGTVTDRDLTMRILAEGHPPQTTVREAMTHEVVACKASEPVRLAERLMARNHKSRVVVVDEDGTLVGVISLSDVAERDATNAARTMREVAAREN